MKKKQQKRVSVQIYKKFQRAVVFLSKIAKSQIFVRE